MNGSDTWFARTLGFFLLFGCSVAAFADWDDDPTGKKFYLAGGAFFPKLDTVVSVEGSKGEVATEIDFESSLGMDRSDTLPIFRGYYRFNKKHRVDFGYFDLKRSGLGVSDVQIRFGDETFPANLPLNSFFDVKVFDLAYGYTVFHSPKADLELSLGLSIQDIEIGIQDNMENILKSETEVTAPLPTFGASGIFAFTDKLVLHARAGVFAVELDLNDNDFEGRIIDVELSLIHYTFKNVGIGAGYVLFDVDVDYTDDRFKVSADYEYRGPMALINVYF